MNTFGVSGVLKLDKAFTLGSELCLGTLRSNNIENSSFTKTNAKYFDVNLGFKPNFNEPNLIFETHAGIGFSDFKNSTYQNHELISNSNLNYYKLFFEFDIGYRSSNNNFEVVFPIQLANANYYFIDTYNDTSLN